MRVLTGREWAEEALDYHRPPDCVRLQVRAIVNLEPVTGLYFVPQVSVRVLWNYAREVGPVGVWRKTRSRLRERLRNEKWVSLGVGTVLEAPEDATTGPGATVGFLAPMHPRCVERLVLAPELLVEVNDLPLPLPDPGVLLHLQPEEGAGIRADRWWEPLVGWCRDSGTELKPETLRSLEKALPRTLAGLDLSGATALPVHRPSPVTERSTPPTRPARTGSPAAILFGYGHYAKTMILPNIGAHVVVDTVHEIDPTQIPRSQRASFRWDTAGSLREDERYDALFVAGYHHTHAALAARALAAGRYAVVEKPVAVDEEQLESILGPLAGNRRGLFACFHKRYSPLNDLAREDLAVAPGAPIDYHCIVYEVPLPLRHWYRWPNSKSRMVSNGCHWLDHFLFLNGFEEVEDLDVRASSSGVVNCSVGLRNGAFFTMVLTDKGSGRIGLQEYVELRAGEVTVKVTNNARYLAEDGARVVRRARIPKLLPYRSMYEQIARKIAAGEEGDSLQSVRVSGRLILEAERRLQALGVRI